VVAALSRRGCNTNFVLSPTDDTSGLDIVTGSAVRENNDIIKMLLGTMIAVCVLKYLTHQLHKNTINSKS